MKVLIFGATGFIGKYLLLELKNMDLTIFYRSHKPKVDETFRKVRFIQGDLLNLEDVSKCFDKEYDIILNLVGQITSDINEIRNLNIKGLNNICENLKKGTKIIHFSTTLVYGGKNIDVKTEDSITNPENEYARIKVEAENLLLNKTSDGIIIRLGNVYGKGQKNGLIKNIIDSVNNNKKLKIPTNRKVRTFVHAYDVARAVKKLIQSKCKHKIYNIGFEQFAIIEIIDLVEKIFGLKVSRTLTATNDENFINISSKRFCNEFSFNPKINLTNYLNSELNKEK